VEKVDCFAIDINAFYQDNHAAEIGGMLKMNFKKVPQIILPDSQLLHSGHLWKAIFRDFLTEFFQDTFSAPCYVLRLCKLAYIAQH
jgi:hypothetical protein